MIDSRQRAQRERGLCEEVEVACPNRATLIVSPYAEPLNSRRLCDEHGDPFRHDEGYHIGEMRPVGAVQ